MMRIPIFAALLLLSAPGAAQSPKADRPQIGGVEVELSDGVGQQTLDSERVFALVAPSVYVVRAGESYDALDRGFQGSAVAIQPHRLLTNCHVVRNSRAIFVVSEGWTVPAKLELQDAETDRCILWVDTQLKPVKTIRTYASLRIGERVYTIGAPRGLELTIGDGLISGKRDGKGLRLVQTSAPISPGSSGGGLFDQYGNLVGITTFILRESQNINFAIPAEDFARLGSQPPPAPPQAEPTPPQREKPPALAPKPSAKRITPGRWKTVFAEDGDKLGYTIPGYNVFVGIYVLCKHRNLSALIDFHRTVKSGERRSVVLTSRGGALSLGGQIQISEDDGQTQIWVDRVERSILSIISAGPVEVKSSDGIYEVGSEGAAEAVRQFSARCFNP